MVLGFSLNNWKSGRWQISSEAMDMDADAQGTTFSLGFTTLQLWNSEQALEPYSSSNMG